MTVAKTQGAMPAQLKQQILQAPTIWDPWLVFADWLTDQGDVRGQIIVLEHRRATETLSKAEARKLDRAILTLEGEKPWRRHLERWESIERVTFQHGFVRKATFWGNFAGRAFVELCGAEEAWLLEEAIFEPFDATDMAILAASHRLDDFRAQDLHLDPEDPEDTAILAASKEAGRTILPGGGPLDGTWSARQAAKLLRKPFQFAWSRRDLTRFTVRRG